MLLQEELFWTGIDITNGRHLMNITASVTESSNIYTSLPIGCWHLQRHILYIGSQCGWRGSNLQKGYHYDNDLTERSRLIKQGLALPVYLYQARFMSRALSGMEGLALYLL